VAIPALLAGLAVAGLAYYASTYDGKIFPGATILGADLSGKTPAQARQILVDRAASYGRAPLDLRHGGRAWTPTPEQLGLSLDVDPLVRSAYERGRTGSLVEQWRQRLPLVSDPVQLSPQYVLDRAKIDAYAGRLAADIERAPVDSKLSLRPGGQFVASAEVPGQRLDTPAAANQVYGMVSRLERKPLALPVQPVAPAQTRDAWRDARALAGALSTPVALTHKGRSWTLAPSQLATAVVAQGGAGAVVGRFDAARIEALLDPVAAAVYREPVNASLKLVGVRASLTPEALGEKLDVGATARAIATAIPGDRVVLSTDPIPAKLTAAGLAPAKRSLDTLLGSPLKLRTPNKTLEVPVQTLASWARLRLVPARNTAVVWVAPGPVKERMEAFAPEVRQDPRSGRLTWQNNRVIVLQRSVTGYRLKVDEAAQLVTKAAFWPRRMAGLPVITEMPRVPTDNIAALGIRRVIGRGSSMFKGSPPERKQNIRAAAGHLNNTVVAPGETFSFLESIGAIDEGTGYVKGKIIKGGMTVDGLGGGVCQVSTTMFRAAFWAGMKMKERNQHAYLVSYYQSDGSPPGFDAAVVEGGIDLKWRNITDDYILIRTYLSKNKLEVVMYGTDIGLTVKMWGPRITDKQPPKPARYVLDPTLPPWTVEQSDRPHQGAHVILGRTVYQNGKYLFKSRFHSTYKPWGAVYRVGPARWAQMQRTTPSLTTPVPADTSPD
jgi:vancomycin resistance protein YoaR